MSFRSAILNGTQWKLIQPEIYFRDRVRLQTITTVCIFNPLKRSKLSLQTKAASLINVTMKYRSKAPGIKTRKGPLGFNINGHVSCVCLCVCVYMCMVGSLYIFIAEQILKTHFFNTLLFLESVKLWTSLSRAKKEGREGEMGKWTLIAAHIYASSWALGAPGLPKSPHQIRSLGLSASERSIPRI